MDFLSKKKKVNEGEVPQYYVEGKKDGIIAAFDLIKDTAFATADLEKEKRSLQEELNVTAELLNQCIQENAHVALDQGEYQTRFDAMSERFDKTKERLETVGHAITEKQAQREKTEMFISVLKKQDEVPTKFSENLWYSLVDYVTVFSKEDVRFTFKDGTEISVLNPSP